MKIKNYKKVSTRIKRTVYEWQEIFDVWSEMMDVEYPEKDERNVLVCDPVQGEGRKGAD